MSEYFLQDFLCRLAGVGVIVLFPCSTGWNPLLEAALTGTGLKYTVHPRFYGDLSAFLFGSSFNPLERCVSVAKFDDRGPATVLAYVFLGRCSAMAGKRPLLRPKQCNRGLQTIQLYNTPVLTEICRLCRAGAPLVERISYRRKRHFCQIQTTFSMAHFRGIARRSHAFAQPMRTPRPTANSFCTQIHQVWRARLVCTCGQLKPTQARPVIT